MTEAAQLDRITTAAPIVELMFNRIWRNRPDMPKATELSGMPIQAAVAILREVTGITHEDLAKRIFVTIPQLNNITLRGMPMRAEFADRFAVIAREVGAHDLYDYFVFRANALRRVARKRRNDETR